MQCKKKTNIYKTYFQRAKSVPKCKTLCSKVDSKLGIDKAMLISVKCTFLWAELIKWL